MTFDEWVRIWFERQDDWSAASADDLPWELSPRDSLRFASELFTNAGTSLSRFTKAQVGNGLWGIISEGQDTLLGLLDPSIALTDRVRCIDAIERVYTDVFAPRCDEALGHLNEAPSPLNTTCYMWWDIFLTGPAPALDAAILSVLQKALRVPHAACQESALHGLGHWRRERSAEVEAIVDEFLRCGQPRRQELIGYAQQARLGMVQ